MSDYTPDTDKVRMLYVHGTIQYQRLLEDGDEPNVVEINREFDRWLDENNAEVYNEGFDDGKKQESERIVALLEGGKQ